MKRSTMVMLGFLLLFSCQNRNSNVEVTKTAEVASPHVFINDTIKGVKLGASVQECSDALGIWEKNREDYYTIENMHFAGIKWNLSTLHFYDGKLEKVEFISRSYNKSHEIDNYLLECNIRNMEQLKEELDKKYMSIKTCDYNGFDTDTIAPSDTYFFTNSIIFMFMSSSSLDRSCIYEYDDGKNLVSLAYHQWGILSLTYVNKELFDRHVAQWTPSGHSDDL